MVLTLHIPHPHLPDQILSSFYFLWGERAPFACDVPWL